MIELASIPLKGRGLKATQPIFTSQVLEVAPYVPMSKEAMASLSGFGLAEYPFADPVRYDPQGAYPGFMVFGLMSFANHSDNPNAIVSWGRDAKLVAVRSIGAGEEITIYYTDRDRYDRETWPAEPKGLPATDGGAQVLGERSRL